MTLSVVTPTCDRPETMHLLGQWMRRQTRQPEEWIVADGGRRAAQFFRTNGVDPYILHLWDQSVLPGVLNFLDNLERGLAAATGDLIVIMEDDDWYDRTHLEMIEAQLTEPGITIAGDGQQRYYNLAKRRYRLMQNKGASLCQTGFRRELRLPLLHVIADQRARVTSGNLREARRAIGVDYYFWHAVPRQHWSLHSTSTVVGMKGLPGQPGLGIGHRPASGWTPDPDGAQLARWVDGEALALYQALMDREAAAALH